MQNELKVIENELVPVYETSTGEKVVYGSELYATLEAKSRYNDWIRNRLNDCEAIENEGFEAFTKNLVNGGQTKEYIIKLDTAKEMAMLERNDKGKRVRRYFIQVENKYKEQIMIPKSNFELLQMEFEILKEVDAKIDDVNRDLQDFKMDLPILGIEIDKITSVVHKRGVNALGGKDSNAYQSRSIRARVYSDIYGELKRQFGVGTYKAIKRNQCELAVSIVEEYELPIILEEQIKDCNAQINMGVA